MWALSENPIHCLDCNLEVAPEALPLPPELVDPVADWCGLAGAIGLLELDSGAYEAWARTHLLDPESPVNRQGRDLQRRLDGLRRCYYWLFQPEADDDRAPPTTCPICGRSLATYQSGIFSQLLCESCSVVLPSNG